MDNGDERVNGCLAWDLLQIVSQNPDKLQGRTKVEAEERREERR